MDEPGKKPDLEVIEDGEYARQYEQMFREILYGHPDAWKPIHERIAPRRGHLTCVSASGVADDA